MSRKVQDLAHSRILDGLLIDKSHFAETQLAELSTLPIPTVCVNGRVPRDAAHEPNHPANMVCIDHRVGAQMATEHLLQLGHRRIGVIAPVPFEIDYGPAMLQARATGFRDAFARRGLEWDPDWIKQGSLTDPKVTVGALDGFLGMEKRPTALYVADDAMALLAINHLRYRGLSVPADLSVMGYGGMSALFNFEPELTTIRAPWRRMGEAGVDMLLSLIAGDELAETTVILNPELVQGETVIPLLQRTVS